MEQRIMINGAGGRIGRAITHEFFSNPTKDVLVAQLNDPVGIDGVYASLTNNDTVHGTFDWQVEKKDDQTLLINGQPVTVTGAIDAADMHLQDRGITIVEECSGFYKEKKDRPDMRPAQVFLDNGAERVILSYPANADKTLIMGVNHYQFDPYEHWLISNGSCTTKAVAAPLQVLLNLNYRIFSVHVDTVHASTQSEKHLDISDKIRMKSTGASRSVVEAIPSLQGLMDAVAERVPTSDGSIANIYAVIGSRFNLDATTVNGDLQSEGAGLQYYGRLGFFDGEDANTKDHIVGRRENSVVLTRHTKVHLLPFEYDGHRLAHCCIVAGYDNERGPPRDQALLTGHIAFRVSQAEQPDYRL